MSISRLHDASQLALAAYGSFENTGAVARASLTVLNGDHNGFSEQQAAAFASRFEIASATFSDPTSFDATVFRELATGNLTLAIRGTQQRFENPNDLDDCLAIVDIGMAIEQIVALYNFVRRITAAPGTMVPQYNLKPSFLPPSGHSLLYHVGPVGVYLSNPNYVAATGTIFDSLGESTSKKLTIAGSSLGGHLTIAASTLFPTLTERAFAFNAPGFGPSIGVQRLFTLLGASRPESPAVLSPNPGSKIANVVSNESPDENERSDFVAGMWGYPGDGVTIPIEDQTLSDVPDRKRFSGNHDQRQVTDSLAVYTFLNKLDTSLELTEFGLILRASASGENRSLENVLDDLERRFGIDSAPMPAGNSNRDHLYQALDRLVKTGTLSELAGKVAISQSTNNMAALARHDFGSLLGLSILSTLQVTGIAGQESFLETALAPVHQTLYNSWKTDRQLTPAQRENGEETFSSEWLQNRAAMLEALALRNTHNITHIGLAQNPLLTVRIRYEDVASKELLLVGDKLITPHFDIRFGSDGADQLLGSSPSDTFYGGSGSDTLEGGAGADRLEGNADDDNLLGGEGIDTLLGGAGNDVLDGGDGNDSLLGGAGDDELNGNRGNDLLRGGPGKDRYLIKFNGGNDEINDSDSIGTIEVEGIGVIDGVGALKLSASSWLAPDSSVLYSLTHAGPTSSALHLTFAGGGTLTVSNWRSGGLGITLGNTAPSLPSWQYFTGDFTKKLEGTEYVFNGYNYVSVGASPNAMDLIHGAAVSSHISGGGGNDGLSGKAASDLIDGGEGNDLLLGNLGADTLFGGAGNDLIHGSGTGGLEMPLSLNTQPIVAPGPEISRGLRWVYFNAGNDADGIPVTKLLGADASTLASDAGNLIDAGAGNDSIFAGSGNDIVYGGLGHDEIEGLGGFDVLEGDDGNDTIFGDGAVLAGSVDSVAASLHGADLINGGAGNDSLTGQGGSDWLYGGTGDDKLSGDEYDKRFTPWEFHGSDHLDGGEGSDELIGEGGSDTLLGGEGQDSLFGDASTSKVAGSHHGEDRLDGGAGNDYLEGGGRADTLIGGADNDMLWGDAAIDTLQAGEAGADWLDGGDGRDTLVGGEFGDTLYGGAGDDQLTGDGAGASLDLHDSDMLDGGSGNDILIGDGGPDGLYGGEGDDVLFGGDGSDLLAGGDGTDRMEGGAGDDVYLIGASPLNSVGDAETIEDHAGSNSIIFERFASTAIQTAARSNGDLQFVSPTGDALLVIGGARNAGNTFQFADGLQFDTSSLIRNLSVTPVVLTDSSGHEQAIGGRNADMLTVSVRGGKLAGGLGNDVLRGKGGSNSYLYSLGDGSDTIIDNGVAQGLTDPIDRSRIIFGKAITTADLRLSNGNWTGGFRIQVGPDPNDSITLGDFNASSGSLPPIDGFQFADGTELSFAQLISLGIEGGLGDDIVAGTAFDDRLSGSFGNDLLVGGAGSDTYRWAPGEDSDTISEAPDGAVDTLDLGGSVSSVDLMLLRRGDDLIVRMRNDAQQQVIVNRQFVGEGVEQLRFGDGTVWNQAAIVSNLVSSLTAGDDLYSGSSGADQIQAGEGHDQVHGMLGDDLIDGGSGRDTLHGQAGNDTLLGDSDDDYLSGDLGNDRLEGGSGNNTLLGLEGQDTLIAGAGQDYLAGGDGDDLLVDGMLQSGGRGSDKFEFTTWRSATVEEESNDPTAIDRLLLPIPSTSARLDVQASNYAADAEDLRINAALFGTASITVRRYFHSPNSTTSIESFTFSDGVTWSTADIHAMMPINRLSDAADFGINGFAWNDIIDAKGGNDMVSGRGGDDSIIGAAGDDMLYGNLGSDTLIGGSGADYLYGDSSLATAEDGNDRLEGDVGLDTLEGAGGNDTLVGGSGDDRLLGGTGDDSYLLDLASSFDRIEDAAGIDTIVLGTGITSSRVGLFADGKDLVVTIDQTVVQARLVNHQSGSVIEQIRFADGSSWDSAAMKARTTGGVANSMVGTTANNSFVVDHADDTISEELNQGTDSVSSSVSYVLPSNVENLTLTGFLNLTGTGNTLDNVIVGNAGSNYLNGLTGYNTLRGGGGDDVYRINPHYDTVAELSGQGIDTVLSEWDYVLPDHVENLSHAPGWSRPISLTGNALANVISVVDASISGSNLDGAGGADTMIAYGFGAIFHVDDAGDVLIGTPGHVVSGLDWTLAPDWRDLVLTGAADHGVGNSSANELVGSSNPDRLEGLEGNDTLRAAEGSWSKQSTLYYDSLGPDTLVGGRGHDWYEIDWNDAARDMVIELPGEGIDTVEIRGAMRIYDLAEFPNVENLALARLSGTSGLRGNTGANRLIGNDSNNSIDGGSGDDILEDQPYSLTPRNEADTLLGGAGYDSIHSRSGDDLIDAGINDDFITLGEGSSATIVFNLGSGGDLVQAKPLTTFGRHVAMGDGVRPADLVLTRDITSLAFSLQSSPTDSLNWLGFYADGTTSALANSLTSIDFADGFSLKAEHLALRAGLTAPDLATSGNDVLLGSPGLDVLSGLAGDDLIHGSEGADELQGGTGQDTLHGGHGNDVYRYERGDGVDWLVDAKGDADVLVLGATIKPADVTVSLTDQYSANYSVMLTLQLSDGSGALLVGKEDELPDIDNVRFADGTVWSAAMLVDMAATINGTAGADSITGTEQSDRIFGFAGNDTLRGGYGDDRIDGGTGIDQMRGEHGDDTYLVDATSDTAIEDPGRGFDSVFSSVSFILGSNVESLQLTGSAPVNATGNSAANWLGGNSGNNLIDGAGGADTMTGGAGNDSYRVDTALDVVIESFNEGADLVTSTVHHTLALHVENLTLSGTNALNGYGNDLANLLTGNSGINRLEGGAGDDTLDGGAGGDAMFGGAGNDRYVVGTGDSVTESSGQGTDTIVTGLTWTLLDHFENLSLTGSSKVRGTGNGLDNWLIGNAAGNELFGLAGRDTLDGGAGSDTLRGGAGDDVYHVDATGDSVVENINEGTDEVISSVSLPSLGLNLEHLTLTGSALKGTGNALANRLIGNAGANTLAGLAGADTLDGAGGNDTLAGGAGADTYLFGRGSGADVVQENEATAGVRDIVMLQGTLTRADLRFSRLSNDLEMSIIGAADKMVFQGWYLGNAYHAEEFRFNDGSMLNDTEAQALVGAMAAFGSSASAGEGLTIQPRMTIGTVDYTSNVVL